MPLCRRVYRPAATLPDDYAQAFATSLSDKVTGADYSCNCILNYLYGEMEGAGHFFEDEETQMNPMIDMVKAYVKRRLTENTR